MVGKKYKNKGMALVSVMTVLTVVGLLCIYFISALKMETNKDLLYLGEIRARFLAQAGLQMAISRLKYGEGGARDNFCDWRGEDWYYKAGAGVDIEDASAADCSFAGSTELDVDYGGGTRGEIKIKILDSASQINVNSSSANLVNILANLPGMSGTLAANIISRRSDLGGFSFEEQIKDATGMSSVYDSIKDYITIASWEDDSASDNYNLSSRSTSFSTRSPVNVNTAPREVLSAVINTYNDVAASQASNISNRLYNYSSVDPFNSWQEFETFISNNTAGFGSAARIGIKKGANPNRLKWLSGDSITSYSGTELCFHGGGYYEIEVYARVYRVIGGTIARRKIRSLVKISDILQHTKKSDFRDENTDNGDQTEDSSIGKSDWDGSGLINNANYTKVTWLDSCPIDEGDDREANGYSGTDSNKISPFGYKTMPNSVKLGFWDDFDEDVDTNQSRAWWGNEQPYHIEIDDIGTYYNSYKYQVTDMSDRTKEASFDTVEPTLDRLHVYDYDVVTDQYSFHLDDSDNEIWSYGSGGPMEITNDHDYSKYYIGGRGTGIDYPPSLSKVPNFFRQWTPENGFYFRVFNHDGARTSIGTTKNFPGYRWKNEYDPTFVPDPPGRDRRNNGRVLIFGPTNYAQFFLHPIGNIYETGGAAKWGDFWAFEGPCFYVEAGGDSVLEYAPFQRDKVYKLTSDGSKFYYRVYGSRIGEIKHSKEYDVDSNCKGFIHFHSCAQQAAWDDVRVIDSSGRYANRFILPEEGDFGSMHFNVYLPQDAGAFFAGTTSGGAKLGSTNNITDYTNESDFLSGDTSNYAYPDISYSAVALGTSVIEGPSESGKKTCSYSVRLTAKVDVFEPQVPAIEDVSVNYLPKTKILYCYDK